jgi:hypothetical protein
MVLAVEGASMVPGLVFAALAFGLTVISLVPSLRGRLRWGRFGSGPRLSWAGWLSWILAMGAISLSLLCQGGVFELQPEIWAGAVLVAFLMVVAAGVYDSSRNSGKD